MSDFFPALYAMMIPFQCRIFFRQGFPCKIYFSPRNQSAGYIFFWVTHTPPPPVKSQMVGLLSTSIVPSQIKGPKNYVQLQHLHPIEIHWKVYLRKFQILCWPQCGRRWFNFHRFGLSIIILGIHEKRLCITRASDYSIWTFSETVDA